MRIEHILGMASAAAPAIISLLAVSTPAAAGQTGRGPISCVIELYTSQGCSSCPPADALMQSYSDREGVLALSFNVDIWDNLGWKDTLASHKFTERQRQYARMRGDGQVYTPQTVINGMAHAVGSDRAAIDGEIKKTEAKISAAHVVMQVKADGGDIEVAVPTWSAAGTAPIDATLWLVKITPSVPVAVARGENAGQTITYHNVVRELTSVGHWMGEANSTRLKHDAVADCKPGTCAVILQQGGTGSVLGAAWVPGVGGT